MKLDSVPIFDGHNDVLLRLYRKPNAARAFVDGDGEGQLDLPRAKRIRVSPLPSQLKNAPQERIDCIALSNVEFGNRLYNAAARLVAGEALKMLH